MAVGEYATSSGKRLSIRSMPPELTALIEPYMHQKEYSTGEYLMRQGETAQSIMVISSGVVEVFTTDASGKRQHINKVSAGDVLGEMSLLTGEKRTASVVALSDVKSRLLPAGRFHQIAHQHPELSVVLTQLVADRLAGKGPDVLHGKSLNDYRIVRRLGRGGMSIVYEAVDPDGRLVALKMMSHSLVYDEYARAQFEREAKIIESLDHDNIVRVYGRFAAFHSYFLVMEHCRGANLSEVIKRQGALPAEEIKKLLGQLAQALLNAHQADLVHRDIKPSNVMLTEEGQIKLMDFGLAAPVFDQRLTDEDKHVVGTPRYMAPEQMAGEIVGPAADYFALGGVIYELLSGTPLFNETKLTQLLRRHAEWDLPDLDALPETPGNWCRQLLDQCLQQDPKQRRPELQEVATWAAPVDIRLLSTDQVKSAQGSWEDDTIIE